MLLGTFRDVRSIRIKVVLVIDKKMMINLKKNEIYLEDRF